MSIGNNPAVSPATGRPAEVGIPTLVVTEAEAAQMLRLSPRTVQRMRLDGEGPRFIALTGRRIGYAVGDLQEWVRWRSVSSTAEATVRAATRQAA